MLGDNIKKIRKNKGMSINKLAEMSNISLGYLSDIENNKKENPSRKILQKIANTLEVSYGYLLGNSIKAIIENKLKELNVTFEELSEKSGVPITFFNTLEDVIPDEVDYKYINPIAAVLNIKPGMLYAAFARQEPPVYDESQINAKEDFNYKSDTNNVKEEVATYKTTDKILESLGAVNSASSKITDIKEAMDLILAQPGLMLNGEALSDESKIALANAIQLGLQYAEQMQKKENNK